MGLTISDQLKLMSGEIKPPSNDLIVIVHQAALIASKRFYDTHKTFDGALTPEAQNYLNKLFVICDRVFKKDPAVIQQLLGITVLIIGTSPLTIAEITDAKDNQWETFILEKMDESFEYLAGVKRDEKAIYKNLKKEI